MEVTSTIKIKCEELYIERLINVLELAKKFGCRKIDVINGELVLTAKVQMY